MSFMVKWVSSFGNWSTDNHVEHNHKFLRRRCTRCRSVVYMKSETSWSLFYHCSGHLVFCPRDSDHWMPFLSISQIPILETGLTASFPVYFERSTSLFLLRDRTDSILFSMVMSMLCGSRTWIVLWMTTNFSPYPMESAFASKITRSCCSRFCILLFKHGYIQFELWG